jgi:hypothetical protein
MCYTPGARDKTVPLARLGWSLTRPWERLHALVLDRMGQQGLLDWSRAAVDSVSARRKGKLTGPSPTTRGKAGTNYQVALTPQRTCETASWSSCRRETAVLAPLS